MRKKVALIILDGFGLKDDNPMENAIHQSITPTFDYLFTQPYAKLGAAEDYVGVPAWQMGNSEVWHMTLWAGRIIKQNIVKIDDMLDDEEFQELPEYTKAIEYLKSNNSNLHIMGLFGPGWVHAQWSHLNKLLTQIPDNINIYLHLFWDGRDLAPDSMLEIYKKFEAKIKNKSNIHISSISGRYYAMDRDNNRERTKQAYDEIVTGNNYTTLSPLEYIQFQYNEDIKDEFITPVSFTNQAKVSDNDVLFFMNFRADRARQLTQAFTDTNFDGFKTKEINNLYFVTMTKYYGEYQWDCFIKDENIKNTLGEVLANNGMRQLRLAETEKFAHVTRFFDGNKTAELEWKVEILIPSHKVATYDIDPEMSANEIWKDFKDNMGYFEAGIVNFANPDMVWHTGNMKAVITAVQKLDDITEKLIKYSRDYNMELIITSDHGNCEEMGNESNPITAHTTNLVPCWYIKNGEVQDIKAEWWLADIAPTMLKLLDIEKPIEMSWDSLI